MWNQLRTVLLLGALSVLLVAVGGFLGRGYLIGFGVLAVAMNFISYFWSDKIVLRLHRARPLSERELPWLHADVEAIAHRAGIPKPRLYVVPEHQPNAFATGRNPQNAAVAVTQGIVSLLERRELRGVLAHELAHVKNRDVLVATIAAALAAIVTYASHVLQWGALLGGVGGRSDEDDGSVLGALAFAILAPIGATLVQLGISRSREYHADETGAVLTGDPQALASALEKLHAGTQQIPARVREPATASLFIANPLAGRSWVGLFSTHPPMEERVRRLRAMSRGQAAA